MRHFSIYDLPQGRDRADFSAPAPGGFGDITVRFYERGDTSDTKSVAGGQEMLIVKQGRGGVVVNGVTNKVQAGDVMVLDAGDVFKVVADEIDPPVILSVTSSGGQAPAPAPQRRRYSSGLETSIMGPD